MATPTITPITPDQASYVVQNSTSVLADMYLTNLDSEANFFLTYPAAAAVKLNTVPPQPMPLDLIPLIGQPSQAFAGRTVTVTSIGANQIDVHVLAPAPANEYWQISAIDTVPGTFTVQRQNNATIRRMLAP